ncbi:hypothetical protein [Neobacillus massiliamazoniensis]|uniref:Uncharacterized protein n=1 Tax=Neobacillus massiliamazoniensis TaxID=1499688 RepID=A0A0U1NZ09_9BACI|nr:hypothetical protein [Neobacillus massiliamazoniensis]CRK83213.1 hypothetical protein BN000_03173 [Neobacillus massiliamazoniensis]
MGEKKKKNPFLTDKPSGTLPKRDKDNSLLLNLNKKMKDNIDKLKESK